MLTLEQVSVINDLKGTKEGGNREKAVKQQCSNKAVALLAGLADGLVQDAVVSLLLLDGGEQVRHDPREELEVLLQELGHIHVSDGPEANQLLQQRPRSDDPRPSSCSGALLDRPPPKTPATRAPLEPSGTSLNGAHLVHAGVFSLKVPSS